MQPLVESRISAQDDLVVGPWGARFRGRDLPASHGRGGIRPGKREGDGVSPAGIYRLTFVFWRADRCHAPVTSLPVFPLGPRQGWSEAP
ncbi:MAG: hypothetical protein AAF317_06070, partial [Pseudomonadota bacterium]